MTPPGYSRNPASEVATEGPPRERARTPARARVRVRAPVQLRRPLAPEETRPSRRDELPSPACRDRRPLRRRQRGGRNGLRCRSHGHRKHWGGSGSNNNRSRFRNACCSGDGLHALLPLHPAEELPSAHVADLPQEVLGADLVGRQQLVQPHQELLEGMLLCQTIQDLPRVRVELLAKLVRVGFPSCVRGDERAQLGLRFLEFSLLLGCLLCRSRNALDLIADGLRPSLELQLLGALLVDVVHDGLQNGSPALLEPRRDRKDELLLPVAGNGDRGDRGHGGCRNRGYGLPGLRVASCRLRLRGDWLRLDHWCLRLIGASTKQPAQGGTDCLEDAPAAVLLRSGCGCRSRRGRSSSSGRPGRRGGRVDRRVRREGRRQVPHQLCECRGAPVPPVEVW
mmetsp:Transcript_105028/g.334388  ORF Transcript_105028/g.334388 Transcript_105028/m.334388 type:complete len:396 (-) Transcript_105028:422-1609(-)